MLYRDNEGLKLCTKKVIYAQRGELLESFITTEGVGWWNDFASKWDHTTIGEFQDIEYTQEQLDRFEEIKEIKANEEDLLEYVLNGNITEALSPLMLKKTNEELVAKVDELIEILVEKGVVY